MEKDETMAAEGQDKAAPAAAAQRGGAAKTIGVRLVPAGDGDLPVLANFARAQVSSSGCWSTSASWSLPASSSSRARRAPAARCRRRYRGASPGASR